MNIIIKKDIKGITLTALVITVIVILIISRNKHFNDFTAIIV